MVRYLVTVTLRYGGDGNVLRAYMSVQSAERLSHTRAKTDEVSFQDSRFARSMLFFLKRIHHSHRYRDHFVPVL